MELQVGGSGGSERTLIPRHIIAETRLLRLNDQNDALSNWGRRIMMVGRMKHWTARETQLSAMIHVLVNPNVTECS